MYSICLCSTLIVVLICPCPLSTNQLTFFLSSSNRYDTVMGDPYLFCESEGAKGKGDQDIHG